MAVPVTATKPNDPVLFKPPGGDKKELYVMTVVDPVSQIFQATMIKTKAPHIFAPTDQVEVIPPPANGAVILAF